MKLVDLSTPIIHNGVSDPPEQRANILYIDHTAGVESLLASFPGAVVADLPSGTGWAFEMLSLSTHTGTHMDAPWHYGPTSEGTVAPSIDQIPLEWCFSNGVCFDFSDRPDGTLLESDDFSAALKKMEYTLKPLDIVLVQSGAGPWFNKDEYIDKGVGVGREATLWLTAQGVRVVGTDAWSWDRPFSFTREKYTHTKDASIIWEGHFAGIERGYFQMEKMGNLDKLPSCNFKVACFPVNIEKASSGWVRPIAIL